MTDTDFVYGEYVAKTRKNDAVKIGDTWYSVAEKIQQYLDNFAKGDKVKFKFDDKGKKKVIFLLYKADKDGTPAETSTPKEEKPKGKTNKEDKPDQKYWDDRNDSIKRQGYVRSAAVAIPALGNVDDVETLGQMIIALADFLLEWDKTQK